MKEEFLYEIEKSFPGDVFITSGGNLSYKYIINFTGGHKN